MTDQDQTPIEFVSIDLSATAWTPDLNLTECLPPQHSALRLDAESAYDQVVAKIVELEGPNAVEAVPYTACVVTEPNQAPVDLKVLAGVRVVGPNAVVVALLESLGLRFFGEDIRVQREDTAEGHARALITAARQVSADALLTAQQVADRLGLTVAAVRQRAHRNAMPPRVRLGARTIRWKAADIEAMIAAMSEGK